MNTNSSKALFATPLILIVFLFTQCTIVSGNGKVVTKDVKTESYDIIEVDGSMDVELTEGEEGNIQITAEENIIDLIEITVKDNTLYIDTKDGFGFSTNQGIKIKVPVQEISKVKLNGSGDITSSTKLSGQKIEAVLDGSGDITLELDTKTTIASLDGSGDIVLTGATTDLTCELDGSGDINTQNLKAANVIANLDGSGDIEVYAGESIKAEVDGSGDITYKGDPEKVIVKEDGAGDITKLN